MTSKNRTHVILSDMQIPYEDYNLFSQFMTEARALDPYDVTIIGDFMDFPGPSMWSKGTVAEYTSNLQEQIETGRGFLATMRRAFDCPIYFHMGNHEDRIAKYIARYAPALSSLDNTKVESLLGFSEYQVTLAEDYRMVCPGVVTTHGHLGRLSNTAGLTALKLADTINASVICGHTHRLGIVYRSDGVHRIGTQRQLFGMEVGHMMDVAQVKYVKTGSLNWQAGFGVVEFNPETNSVKPTIYPLG